MAIPLIIRAERARRLALTVNASAAGSIATATERGGLLVTRLSEASQASLPLETRINLVLEEFTAFGDEVALALRSTGVANEVAIMARIEQVSKFSAEAHLAMENAVARIGTIERGLVSGRGFLVEEFNIAMTDLSIARRYNQEVAKVLQGMAQSGEIPAVLRAVQQTDTIVLEAIDAAQAVTVATREVVSMKEAYEMTKIGVAAGEMEPSMVSMLEYGIAESEAALRAAEATAARKLALARTAVEAENALVNSVIPVSLLAGQEENKDDFRPLKDNELPNSTMYTRRATRSAMRLADTSINLNRARSDIEDDKAIDASLVRSKRLDSVFDAAATGTTPAPTQGPSL